ncbi:MAG: hypothetical protein KA120_07760 [Candidatus Goldbacteria bacterium]|nr:hypothetical protein [Candidatus Goldiibacteriota bacterium]
MYRGKTSGVNSRFDTFPLLTSLFQRGEINGINLPWPLFFKEGKLME